jgi:hypothetical protein
MYWKIFFCFESGKTVPVSGVGTPYQLLRRSRAEDELLLMGYLSHTLVRTARLV